MKNYLKTLYAVEYITALAMAGVGLGSLLRPTAGVVGYMNTQTSGVINPLLYAFALISAAITLAILKFHEQVTPLSYWMCILPLVLYVLSSLFYITVTASGAIAPMLLYVGFILVGLLVRDRQGDTK